MYDATKNIIITGLLFDALRKVAEDSSYITTSHPSSNHSVFTHTVEGLGDQSLLFSEIENDLVMVTFVGAVEYLDRLEIIGWLESADDLAKYFAELGDDFQSIVGRVSKLQIGPRFTLLIIDNQPIDIQAANDILVVHDSGTAVMEKVEEAIDAVIPPVVEAVNVAADVLVEARDEVVEAAHNAAEAVSEAASATVEKADEVAAKVDGKFRRMFRHPATKYVAGVVLIGAGVALWRVVRAKAESIVPELADVEL